MKRGERALCWQRVVPPFFSLPLLLTTTSVTYSMKSCVCVVCGCERGYYFYPSLFPFTLLLMCTPLYGRLQSGGGGDEARRPNALHFFVSIKTGKSPSAVKKPAQMQQSKTRSSCFPLSLPELNAAQSEGTFGASFVAPQKINVGLLCAVL